MSDTPTPDPAKPSEGRAFELVETLRALRLIALSAPWASSHAYIARRALGLPVDHETMRRIFDGRGPDDVPSLAALAARAPAAPCRCVHPLDSHGEDGRCKLCNCKWPGAPAAAQGARAKDWHPLDMYGAALAAAPAQAPAAMPPKAEADCANCGRPKGEHQEQGIDRFTFLACPGPRRYGVECSYRPDSPASAAKEKP